MAIHDLKIDLNYLDDLISQVKTFEIRKNDRNYKVGDRLRFKKIRSGRSAAYFFYVITYITDYQQKDNYVVLAVKKDGVCFDV